MAAKPTDSACPISAFGLVFMPTYRTPARCASFRAGKAHDVSSFGFVGEIVDIFAVFPQGHTLVVVPALIGVAHAMWVADEERPDLVLNTEVDHLPARFMAQIRNSPLGSPTLRVFRALQLLPAMRILLATRLLFRQLSQLLIALMFEGADVTPSDDQGFGSRSGDSSQ